MNPAMAALANSAVQGAQQVMTPLPNNSSLSDRSSINVAPVGVNLGSILQPLFEGSATNGGSGIIPESRWGSTAMVTPSGIAFETKSSYGFNNWVIYGGIAAVGLAAFVFAKRAK